MTDIDKLAQKLREAAEKATPGHWIRCGGATAAHVCIHSEAGYIVYGMADYREHKEHSHAIESPQYEEQLNNAFHIAHSNPANILAILADRDALKAKLAEAERDRDGALDDRDRLREDVTDARRDRNLTNAALKETCADLSALRSRVETLEAALMPFVEVEKHDIGSDETDEDQFQPSQWNYNKAPKLTIGDFRRARAALTNTPPARDGESK